MKKWGTFVLSTALVAVFTVAGAEEGQAATVSKLIGGQTHGFAIQSDGTVWGFGDNSQSQLGLDWPYGAGVKYPTPKKVGLYAAAATLDTHTYHAVMSSDEGQGYGWGKNFSQLGFNPWRPDLWETPGFIYGFNDLTDVAAGGKHSLALKQDGTVWALGDNQYGQIGNPEAVGLTYDALPVLNLTGVKEVEAGTRYSLALKHDGTVWGFGDNRLAQLGTSGVTQQPLAASITGLDGIVDLDAGAGHALALRGDGTVWYWGTDGSGTVKTVPTQVPGITDAAAISAGGGHSLVLKTDGTVLSFGQNDQGQLGNGTTSNRTDLAFVQVTGLSGVTQISAGGSSSYALTADGKPYAWGGNTYGQLATGSTAGSSVPTVMSTFSPLKVTAAPAADAVKLTISYQGQTSAVRYVVKQGAATVYDGASTQPQITGLQAETPYEFTVQAYDANGKLLETTAVKTVTLAHSIATNLVTNGFTGLTFSYQGTGTVSEYVIKRDGKILYQGTATTFADTGLNVSSNYTYLIESYDAAGQRMASKTVTYRTRTPYASVSLDDFTATTATFGWYPGNFDISRVVVHRGGQVYYDGPGGRTDKANVRLLLPFERAYFTFDFYGADGQLYYSTQEMVWTEWLAMTPTLQTQRPTSLSFTVTANGEIARYVLKRGGQVIMENNAGELTDKRLQPNTSYTYTIEAYDELGRYLGKTDTTVRTAPFHLNVAGSLSDKKVPQLDFQASAPVARYVIKRDDLVVYEGLLTRFVEEEKLKMDQTYTYTVEAFDEDNHLMGSQTVQVTTDHTYHDEQ